MPGLLDNPRADRIKRVRGLFHAAGRRKAGRYVAEGPQAVREALGFAPALELYVTDEAAGRHPQVVAKARERSISVLRATPEVMAAISPDTQGLLAVIDAGGPHEATGPMPGERLASLATHARLVAVFAQMQDPGNAGTAIRAADAAGADVVVLTRGSVEATNPKVVRASAGSLFHVPVLTGLTTAETIETIRAAGARVLAADLRGTIGLDQLLGADLGPVAWLFGNEAHGLTAADAGLADERVRIPMPGRAESLNLAQAATLCLFATVYAQQRQHGG